MKTILLSRAKFLLILILSLNFILNSGLLLFARENKGIVPQGDSAKKMQHLKTTDVCSAPTSQTDLDVNNIRTTILAGGDMWWDLTNPKYEIPKGSQKHSLYAGALWIGGVDIAGQIKVAAQTYRQGGSDFWTGPIDTSQAITNSAVCNAYDKHYTTSRADIIRYINDPGSVSASVTAGILNWPGNGDASQQQGTYLAPFYDANANGVYEPKSGDYPYYNLSGIYPNEVSGYDKLTCNNYLFGDKNLWWVFNDVGNVHTSSNSEVAIGLEIRAQAFAFNTNDEINNMTFYKYQIINRGSTSLNNTYFGQWVDPDLGNSVDDFVGCDVNRGLGFVYNGDEDDDGVGGYGLNPPALGIDFFQGPLADLHDGKDNDRDGCTDCTFLDSAGITVQVNDDVLPEQIIMSKFLYYNNVNNDAAGNPLLAVDFYHYLRGIWIDGVPMTYGGDGRKPDNQPCDFMFPGNTDSIQNAIHGPWSETTAQNIAGDRRFLQSAGPFTLLAGAVNYITTGVVWSRASQGGPEASVELMKLADDKAQALFDNCFKLLDGPDAPTVEIRELNNELVFSLVNTDTTTLELYDEKDPTITGYPDSLSRYRFQGYKIFQLRDQLVSIAELDDPDKARLVKQFDIKDGVAQLVNYVFDQSLGGNIPQLKVNGNDKGISHSFSITTDAFAAGSSKLVNHKNYYFTAVSYAYNQYKRYDPLDPAALDGQKKPYLEGRNNIYTYSAIPHPSETENYGTWLYSNYGDGPSIQRMEGQGNGGVLLDLTSASESSILTSPDHRSYQPIYRAGHGPINLKVYDPMLVKKATYEVRFNDVADTSHWVMTDLSPQGKAIRSLKNISSDYEQLITGTGISTHILKSNNPGNPNAINNGFLEATMTFDDNSNQWLRGYSDNDQTTASNWIWSGTNTVSPADVGGDPKEVYETVLGGTWAPFRFTASDAAHPKWNGGPLLDFNLKLEKLASIDLVITSDKSKWSRCAVVETSDLGIPGQGKKADLRLAASLDKEGRSNYPAPDNNDFSTGMSWFPGYAINLETAERLNIVFGENSSLTEQNGSDMIWNPTAALTDASLNTVLGGMHFIYIMGHNADSPTDLPLYDGCAQFHIFLDSALKNNNTSLKRIAWKDAMWVNIPLVNGSKIKYSASDAGKIFIPPTDVRIRLRVSKDYKPYIKQIRETETLLENSTYQIYAGSVTYNGNLFVTGQQFTTNSTITFTGSGTLVTPPPQNNFNPLYRFNTDNLAAETNNPDARADALAQVNVVPNPYYANSGYEGTAGITGQVDNRVRITNLPADCTIRIFTTNGTLIRQYSRAAIRDNSRGSTIQTNNSTTSLDWDLKNQRGISIGSGMYLIHIEAPGIGERIIKWFGVIRPIDLDTF